jgi:hypothetical protein
MTTFQTTTAISYIQCGGTIHFRNPQKPLGILAQAEIDWASGSRINNTMRIQEILTESKNSLAQWNNDEPVTFVKSLTKKLGQPDELTENRAVWYNKDGFKQIEVLDEYILHCCPAPHYDFVYSTIDLHVPKKYVRVLAESSESIMLDLLKNEVSARCATLSANAVTLNYVLDVVSGRVEGGKDEYESRIKQLYKNKLNPDPEWWPDITKEMRK